MNDVLAHMYCVAEEMSKLSESAVSSRIDSKVFVNIMGKEYLRENIQQVDYNFRAFCKDICTEVLDISNVPSSSVIDWSAEIFRDWIRDKTNGAAKLACIYVNRPLADFYGKCSWFTPTTQVFSRGVPVKELPILSGELTIYFIGDSPFVVPIEYLIGIACKNSSSILQDNQ